MNDELINVLLFIVLGGCLSLGVSIAIGKRLAAMRKEQFGDDEQDDEWNDG